MLAESNEFRMTTSYCTLISAVFCKPCRKKSRRVGKATTNAHTSFEGAHVWGILGNEKGKAAGERNAKRTCNKGPSGC